MNPIIMRFRHIAVSLSCLCLAQLLNAQLTHTVTFDRNLLSIDTTVVDRVSYLKIKYLDLWGEGNIGSPELPVHYLRFSVPYNAVDFTVTITEQNTVTEHYTLPVYPVQPVQPIYFHCKRFCSHQSDNNLGTFSVYMTFPFALPLGVTIAVYLFSLWAGKRQPGTFAGVARTHF